VFGGPHEDDSPESTASRDANVDLSVGGDGETALQIIVETALRYPRIDGNGLIRKMRAMKHTLVDGSAALSCGEGKPGQGCQVLWLRSPSGSPLNLDTLPILPRHLLDRREQFHFPVFQKQHGILKATAQVMTQRGCLATCWFCSESQRVVSRSVQSVARELDVIKDEGYEAVFFDDSTFTALSDERRGFIERLGGSCSGEISNGVSDAR